MRELGEERRLRLVPRVANPPEHSALEVGAHDYGPVDAGQRARQRAGVGGGEVVQARLEDVEHGSGEIQAVLLQLELEVVRGVREDVHADVGDGRHPRGRVVLQRVRGLLQHLLLQFEDVEEVDVEPRHVREVETVRARVQAAVDADHLPDAVFRGAVAEDDVIDGPVPHGDVLHHAGVLASRAVGEESAHLLAAREIRREGLLQDVASSDGADGARDAHAASRAVFDLLGQQRNLHVRGGAHAAEVGRGVLPREDALGRLRGRISRRRHDGSCDRRGRLQPRSTCATGTSRVPMEATGPPGVRSFFGGRP
mmetsp:Transcript_15212/g.59474  ORF Transcript_15212/g.59474 Transcript_15212/m.59474 type:complete len:311 (+) Transcript_15212:836-1768(+)